MNAYILLQMITIHTPFIISLLVSLSLSHSVYNQTVIIVDGKDGDDAVCQNGSHPCKTLDTALNAVENNTIIQIHNGTYSLNTSSTLSHSNVTITGSGPNITIIQCNETGFGFINASNIRINKLTVSECGEVRDSTTLNAALNTTLPFRAALYFLSVVNVTIDNIAVINSIGMGVAMYDVTGVVNVQNSVFKNNSVPPNEHDKYPGGGGLSVEFTFCKPGVVQLNNTNECETTTNINSSYLFYNCTFQLNTATTVDASNTTYVTNSYGFGNQQFGRGGGLSVFFKGKAFNNSVTIDTCTFTHNYAVWGGGFHSDVVDHSKNNTLNIVNSFFAYNHCFLNDSVRKGLLSVNTGGGAVRIALLFSDIRASVQNNIITMEQCNFSRNSAYYGGAMSYKITKEADRTVASNTVSFANCSWFKNKARTGSAVNLEAEPFPSGITPYASFSDCHYINNTNHYLPNPDKPVGIGALYSDNIPVVFSEHCTFSGNKGTALTGSAVFFVLANNSVTRFDKNYGNNGGAIALLGNTYLILHQNTTLWFTHNKAYSKGGAIYFVSSSERDFVSTQKCFIFYSDLNAEQENWNTSLYFQNNTDFLNKSIYATTLLPCVWGNLPGSVDINSTSLDFLFSRTFHFANSSGPAFGDNSMTDVISITVNDPTPIKLSPGRLHSFNITSLDELSNTVTPVFFVHTLNPNESAVDTSTVYTYDNQIRLYGHPNSIVTLKLQTISGRPWSYTINVTLSECPPGFYYNNASDVYSRQCVCTSDGYYGIYSCDNINMLVYLYPYFWAGTIHSKGKLTFVTADCPLGYCNVSDPSNPVPVTLSLEDSAKFETEECLYRNGTLCGKCITGYCVATNSPTYECIDSTSSVLNKYGILWLVILKYIPFTAFLLLIIFFNVGLVDGPLNAYIFFTQIINSVRLLPSGLVHLNELHEVKNTKLFINFYYFLYGPWNSNYFEMLVPDFCAYKFDSTIKVLMFEYIPAFYPLVFFVLFYSIIPCIKNCLINSEADMPRRCLLRVERMFIIFRRTWSIRNSIIHGLATFLVLSYAKVTTVTALLVSSTTLYGRRDAEWAIKPVVRLDGTMDYLKGEHLPYATVAFTILFTVIILPPWLLLSYPLLPNVLNELNLQDKWIFKFLIIKPLDKCVPFFDVFQSCFKNKYRCFAGLYFLYRAMAVAIITIQWRLTTRLIYQQGFFLTIVLIHCVCQPYKLRRYNILDGCIFVILAAINSLSLYNVFNADIYLTTSQASFWIQIVLIYVPFMYFIVFFFHYATKRCASCIDKVKQVFFFCLSKCINIQTYTPAANDDEMPARLLDADSSNESSSSSEDEDDSENDRNVEMRPPIEYSDQHGSSGNQSPYIPGFQNRHNRFTT